MRSRSPNVNLIADTGVVRSYDVESRTFEVGLDAYGIVTARLGDQGSPLDPEAKPRVFCVRLPRSEWLILSEIPSTVVPRPEPTDEEVFGGRRTDPVAGRTSPIGRSSGYRGLDDERTLLGRNVRAGDKLTLGRFGGLVGLFRSGAAIVKSGFGCFSLWTRAKEWINRFRTFAMEGFGFGVSSTAGNSGDVTVSGVVQGKLNDQIPDVRASIGTIPESSQVRLRRGANAANPSTQGLQFRLGPDYILEYDRDAAQVRVSSQADLGRQQVVIDRESVGVHRPGATFNVSDDGILMSAPRVVVAGDLNIVPASATAAADTVGDIPAEVLGATLALSESGDTVDFSTGVRARNSTTQQVEGAVMASHLTELSTAISAIAAHLHETPGSPSVSLATALESIAASLAALSNTSGSATGT